MSVRVGGPNRALPVRQLKRLVTTGPDAAWTLSSWGRLSSMFSTPGVYRHILHTPRQKRDVLRLRTGVRRISGNGAVPEGSRVVRNATAPPGCQRGKRERMEPASGRIHEEDMRVAPARAPCEGDGTRCAGRAGCDGYAGGGARSSASDARARIIRTRIARVGGAIQGCKSQVNAHLCATSGHGSCVGAAPGGWVRPRSVFTRFGPRLTRRSRRCSNRQDN